MLKSLAASVAFLALTTSAYAGYPGCTNPSSTGKAWHIDSVNGLSADAGGDGSAAHPWNSLKAAFADGDSKAFPAGYHKSLLANQIYDHIGLPNPLGLPRWRADGAGVDATQIQAGDTILLATGAYGDIGVSGNGATLANVDPVTGATKWITITKEVGATPVLSTLSVSAARGWYFNGLTIMSQIGDGSASNSGDLVRIGDGGTAALATMDIEVNGGVVESVAALPTQINADGSYKSGWTQADWLAKVKSGVYVGGSLAGNLTKCVTISNVGVYFVNAGVAVSQAENTLVFQNIVNFFAGDAFDAYSTNLVTIDHNHGWNRVDSGNGTHTDSVQLAFNGSNHSTAAAPWHDIVITNNDFRRIEDSRNPFPGYLQGIFNTNDFYDHVTVTGNTLITAACTGIGITATSSIVANNTVVRDGSPGSITPGCNGLSIGLNGVSGTPGILANNVVTGGVAADCHVTVENNISIPTMSGGVAIAGGPQYLCPNGVSDQFITTPGVYKGVTVYPITVANPFLNYSPPVTGQNTRIVPNLQPAVGSVLIGAGVAGPGIPTRSPSTGAAWAVPNVGAY